MVGLYSFFMNSIKDNWNIKLFTMSSSKELCAKENKSEHFYIDIANGFMLVYTRQKNVSIEERKTIVQS